jgi:hypothetical protein
MVQLEEQEISKIEGFSDEEVNFTRQELEKGSDIETLKIILYNKFGLFDSVATELIEEVQSKTGHYPDELVEPNDNRNNNKSGNSLTYGGMLILTAVLLSYILGLNIISLALVVFGLFKIVISFFEANYERVEKVE